MPSIVVALFLRSHCFRADARSESLRPPFACWHSYLLRCWVGVIVNPTYTPLQQHTLHGSLPSTHLRSNHHTLLAVPTSAGLLAPTPSMIAAHQRDTAMKELQPDHGFVYQLLSGVLS